MLNDLIGQIKAELAASKKKAGVLGLLLVVAVFMGVKVLAGGKGPARAAGAVEASPTGSAADAAGSTGPTTKANSRELANYINSIDSKVSRDLFKADFSRFPMVNDALPVLNASPDQALLQSEALATRHPNLTLQSTLDLDRPTAIINGQVLAVGDSIDDCTIVQVGRGYCLLRTGDSLFRIEMNSAREPGS